MKHGTLTTDNHAALWHGRFKEGPDAAAVEFETSIYVDERMAMDDIKGSKAHAKMLGETGIISKAESAKIIKGLESIQKDLESGKLKIESVKQEKKFTQEEAETIRLHLMSVFI